MKKLIHLLTQTPALPGPLITRIFLAIVFFPHGAQKVLGWFGGYGFTATMAMFTGKMGLPYAIALLPVATEFLGSIALFFGFFTRIAALATAVNMLVAILLVHISNGFFMNWSGKQAGEGFEYHLLAIGMALALVAAGGGKFSVDRTLADKTA
ncbi:MAG: DoxX family protein [Methylacidiphilales bacterium]|nr:DoxX family protein [Candidatus Methylacidiphilales bacterium]